MKAPKKKKTASAPTKRLESRIGVRSLGAVSLAVPPGSEPTLTKNGALYPAQHKISKCRTAFFRRLRRAEKSHQRKKGRFSTKRHNGVEIVAPTEVPEAPAHGTGRLVLAACRRYLAAKGGARERKQN